MARKKLSRANPTRVNLKRNRRRRAKAEYVRFFFSVCAGTVFLDEAQDANFVRRQMMARMLKKNGRLVAVDDPCQAIYGFTGADHASLENIAKEFSAQDLPLTVTYRCPKAIVEKAQEWVSHIEAHESAPEGIVDTLTVAKAIEDAVFSESNAILCRNTKPLIEMAYKLIREGTACRVEGRSIG